MSQEPETAGERYRRTVAADEHYDRIVELEQQKDGAYAERNKLIRLLASLFPSGIKQTAIEGWDEDWHWCVYIDLPSGQVSWHFHVSELDAFKDLPAYIGEWDGHDTDEKYRRVATACVERRHLIMAWDLGSEMQWTHEELAVLCKPPEPIVYNRITPLSVVRIPPAADDESRCFACLELFKDGDLVQSDVTEGLIHASCLGPDRDSYVGADGEPLKDGEPIPTPFVWHPWPADFTAAPASGRHETAGRLLEPHVIKLDHGEWLLPGEYVGYENALTALIDAMGPGPEPQEAAQDPAAVKPLDLTNEQKEIVLLRIIDRMGGNTDSGDSKWNWVNWFCSDEVHNKHSDTFNRCHEKGWLTSSHDTSFDTSTTTLTPAGRAALSEAQEARE